MTKFRANRLANEIKKELSDILRHDIDNGAMDFVCVVYVDVSRDLSFAKIYISCFNGDEKEVLAVLTRSCGFIRSKLAKRLYLRAVPAISFHLDDSIAYGVAMSGKIAAQIAKDEAAAKAANMEDGENKL
jgi:ribosome-binding factor A